MKLVTIGSEVQKGPSERELGICLNKYFLMDKTEIFIVYLLLQFPRLADK